MRQLGLAAALYREEDGADWPTGCPQLAQAGRVPEALCSSRADSTPQGLATSFSTSVSEPPPDFRNSFWGVGVLTRNPWSSAMGRFGEAPGLGWLADVSTVEWKPRPSMFPRPGGTYRRLLLDGSVQSRVVRFVEPNLFMPFSLFADHLGDEERGLGQ